MFDIFRAHQLNVMLAFSGICAAMVIMLLFTKALTNRRRLILISIELSSLLLLMFDRFAYIYSGDVSNTGYVMVRVSNFMVFFLSAEFVFAFNFYVKDVLKVEGNIDYVPKPLVAVDALTVLGMLLVISSQFTGLYYSFDVYNKYHRAPLFWMCFVIPLVGLFIQLLVVVAYQKRISKLIYRSFIVFILAPLVASIIQFYSYGISLINLTIVLVAMFLYIFAYLDINEKIEAANQIEVEYHEGRAKMAQQLFEQTSTAFVNAIDAKDEYTHGHSVRVAEYAKKIAELMDKDEEESYKIYCTALLCDVGKIGISDSIITKKGRLTEEEYEEVKKHALIGEQILSNITEYPYLSVGAHYHHERYDGKGYPEGLKGEEIPEIARIIAVADAYDAMTSDRSYREAMIQPRVREEIVKESGSQFDPKIAKIMQHLIDLDTEYKMKEKASVDKLANGDEIVCGEYRSAVSEGILITSEITKIRLFSIPEEGALEQRSMPSIIVFDSLDGMVYSDESSIKKYNYFEYCEVWFGGNTVATGARRIKTNVTDHEADYKREKRFKKGKVNLYEIECVKYKDHVRIVIDSFNKTVEVIIALADNSRYAYIGLTGEHCIIRGVDIKKQDTVIDDKYIPRIANEVSYIDRLVGDVPNVQIDGYRTASTEGILIPAQLEITYHMMTLPTAWLIWHCSSVVLFYSDDGKVNGPNYKEYALVRLDGEYWNIDKVANNEIVAVKQPDFVGWDEWKAANKKGVDIKVHINRKGNRITMSTENLGLSVKCTTSIYDKNDKIYVALSGDQCALTDIRIRK